uniref:hypothetical protein n=1 Tax=Salmonella enterica TaxID=28901 RepID=UPI0014471D73|nr:hypothetical protein [Salmonella enterica]
MKSFDISDHEKAFQKYSNIIRSFFLSSLRRHNISGKLVLPLEHTELTDDIAADICCKIQQAGSQYGYYYLSTARTDLQFIPLPEEDPDTLVHPSDTVFIAAKQHKNEQRNIEYKIRKAADELFKRGIRDGKPLNQLVIRVGEPPIWIEWKDTSPPWVKNGISAVLISVCSSRLR